MNSNSHRSRRMSSYDIPIGILVGQKFARRCCGHHRVRKELVYKTMMLALTYLAYTCYHMTRKPISVVKSVLHTNCSDVVVHNQSDNDCGYAPFDRPDAQKLFGMLDSAFLFSYAAAMFASGFIAERVSLRYFLSLGMISTGILTYLFGAAKTWDIHNLWYFLLVQALAGIVQTTGWPGVVTLVGRWFGKSKRGLIFGIWNSHTSIGNILGTLIAAQYVENDWALSFIVPGIIMGIMGFILFLLVVDSPEMVGCNPHEPTAERHPIANDSDGDDVEADAANYDANIGNYGCLNENSEVNYRPSERTPILGHHTHNTTPGDAIHRHPIGLADALRIPGVVEFSLCLFFSKLVSYTFLYWLPLYIQSSSTLSASTSADLSTLFDVGGIVGAIAAGHIADQTGMSATTCVVSLFFASPILLLYQNIGSSSIVLSSILLIIAGIFVNGPYALITTSVSAELGQHSSLEGNAKALATVTAIIDGTGSIGAAIGPLLAGLISSHGWQDVFYMLIIADILAMLLLVRLVIKEIAKLRRTVRMRMRIE